MANAKKWTKWWWVTYFADFQTWTAVESNVRLALGLSTIPVMALALSIIAELLELVGVERHVAAILAGAMSLVPAFLAARPVAMVFYPDSLRRADENSQRRLSGTSLISIQTVEVKSVVDR